jgi:hypothetical protein
VVQVPAGWLASKLGAKWVMAVGMFISGSFTLLLPIAAKVGHRSHSMMM